MRRTLLMLPLLALAAPAFAQPTPRGETGTTRSPRPPAAGERDAEAIRRGAAPPGPETMRALEDDRRSLGPDVGRPEAEGRLEPGGQRGSMTGGMNPQR